LAKGVAAPVAIGIGIGIVLIAIFVLFFSPPAYSNSAMIEVARSNAIVQEIFRGKEHVVTYQYDGVISIPDYECHIGRCVLFVFSPVAEPEQRTVDVYVNKDSMKVADIRLSEGYLIMKANESPQGRQFITKYPHADVSATLGHWHPEVTYSVLDASHSFQMFVNMTYTGEITGVAAMCESHWGKIDRIVTGISDYIDREVCPAAG
jgi:hypothetical protein